MIRFRFYIRWINTDPPIMNLIDPELELIDPTPNVHALFMHFDKTFFWGQLSHRCMIRWSKRMFSCAGTCSYDKEQHFCEIALSEPLLTLRPRKDLIETMLHEMIHAYLFLTKQDQDRDGHGIKFQTHMHRINRMAGVNVSICHSFHDEVKLYQTHWWRCDGPCQFRRPYFGVVRRTTNRTPGPADYWWSAHQRHCGGTFIKIKEPSKDQSRRRKKKGPKLNADGTKNVPKKKKPISKVPIGSIVEPEMPRTIILQDNKFIVPKIKVDFKTPDGTPSRLNGTVQTTYDVYEEVRALWVNMEIPNNNSQIAQNNSTTPPNLNKRETDNHNGPQPAKIKKIDNYFKTTATSMLKDLYGKDFNITQSKDKQILKVIPVENNHVDCPICTSKIHCNEINKHLDECLNKPIIEELTKENKQAVVLKGDEGIRSHIQPTSAVIPAKALTPQPIVKGISNHFRSISTNNQVTASIIVDLTNMGPTTDANRKRRRTFDGDLKPIAQITDITMSNNNNSKQRKSAIFMGPSTSKAIQNTSPIIIDPSPEPVPSCSQPDTSVKTICPCCGIKLYKSVDEHLDECLAFFSNNDTIPEEGASTSRIIDTIDLDNSDNADAFDDSQIYNATGTKLPCPCCLAMIEEVDMNSHLDECLG